ncbi:hypothetical protein LguiB_017844 [Lonicera macranthoides]
MPDKEEELGPIILHLDSLGLHDSTSIFVNIKRFLKEEWNYLKGEAPSELPIADRIWKNLPRRIGEKIIEVPQHTNEYDSGLFVLSFMERFIEEAPERLKKIDYTMFGRQWFRPQEASDLRQKIRSLLVKEFKREPHNANMEHQICTYVRKRKRLHGVVGAEEDAQVGTAEVDAAEEAVDDQETNPKDFGEGATMGCILEVYKKLKAPKAKQGKKTRKCLNQNVLPPDTVNSLPEATLMEPTEQQNKRKLRSSVKGSNCHR